MHWVRCKKRSTFELGLSKHLTTMTLRSIAYFKFFLKCELLLKYSSSYVTILIIYNPTDSPCIF